MSGPCLAALSCKSPTCSQQQYDELGDVGLNGNMLMTLASLSFSQHWCDQHVVNVDVINMANS